MKGAQELNAEFSINGLHTRSIGEAASVARFGCSCPVHLIPIKHTLSENIIAQILWYAVALPIEAAVGESTARTSS